MSYNKNERLYLSIIQQFLSAELDGEAFCRAFMGQWKADRDEQDALMESWPERYDLHLIEAWERGALTDQEFHHKWTELWGYTKYEPLLEMLNRVFTACDCFYPIPEGQFEIDEDQLKREVAELVRRYEERNTA